MATNPDENPPQQQSQLEYPLPSSTPMFLNDPNVREEFMREMGRRGGLKGGKARAAALSKKERHQIAKQAAAARWGKKVLDRSSMHVIPSPHPSISPSKFQ